MHLNQEQSHVRKAAHLADQTLPQQRLHDQAGAHVVYRRQAQLMWAGNRRPSQRHCGAWWRCSALRVPGICALPALLHSPASTMYNVRSKNGQQNATLARLLLRQKCASHTGSEGRQKLQHVQSQHMLHADRANHMQHSTEDFV